MTTSPLDEALASFGAASAANDRVAIEGQISAARAAGASRAQLQEAVQTAARVQENAARIHIREAERLVGQSATEPEVQPTAKPGAEPTTEADQGSEESGCGADCPCHDEEEGVGATPQGKEGPIAPLPITTSNRPWSGGPCGLGSWPCN